MIKMEIRFKKNVNQDFFKKWTPEMSYILGYIVADGCITVSKDRKNRPFTLNITSIDLKHLYLLKETLESEHKISKKSQKINTNGYQLQIRNPILTKDLMSLGIFPRKTYNLKPIEVPEKYFSHFVRGFFDGDGSVYIYKVNGTPQIKVSFVSVSLSFITHFNRHLCDCLNIIPKIVHKDSPAEKRMIQYSNCFYVDDCNKLAEFMYGNNPRLFLSRKRRIFEKWKLIKRRHYIKQGYPSKVGWRLNEKIFA